MSRFDNKLRTALHNHVKDSNESFYKVAQETGISHQIIYNFRDGNGGLNGENTVKLMKHLNLEIKDLK